MNPTSNIKSRLMLMNFLQFGVWGAYLTSMGSYLSEIGSADRIGIFYAMQGIVSLFMPGIIGVIADRYISAEKLLGLCHGTAALFMAFAGYYGYQYTEGIDTNILFALYSLSVAFYMPTLALSNSVAYNALEKSGLDTIKSFPSIRIFGTIGFICSMWIVDLLGIQNSPLQFIASSIWGVLLAGYALTLPKCPTAEPGSSKSVVEALGLKAFGLLKDKKMATFFIFSMLLGVSLQITNGFANPFLQTFGKLPEYADTFAVKHANILISISQISETLCILLIPFFLGRFGIKNVMLIAMLAWVLRFGLFGLGNPGDGVWMFVLSMLVYGVAFDFFNVSGALFVDKETDTSIRSSAQGLFVIMTNGIGATTGMFLAQAVVNHFVVESDPIGGWSNAWFVFSGYALVVAVLFFILFDYKHKKDTPKR